MKMRSSGTSAFRSQLLRGGNRQSSPMAADVEDGRRGPSTLAEETTSLLERGNDEGLDALHQKVSALHTLSRGIQDEVGEQNRLLDEMETRFGAVGSQLVGTVKKVKSLVTTGGSKHLCYLVMFLVAVFFLLYYWFSRGSRR